VMVNSAEDASPGDIVAPCGFVVILRERDPDPASPAGKYATAIARMCGRGAAPAAFSYYVPALADDAPDGAR